MQNPPAKPLLQKALLFAYFALMLALALTVASVKLKLGHWNTVLNFSIALFKAVVIMLIYMHLMRSIVVTRIFAGLGVFWMMIFVSLILADYLYR